MISFFYNKVYFYRKNVITTPPIVAYAGHGQRGPRPCPLTAAMPWRTPSPTVACNCAQKLYIRTTTRTVPEHVRPSPHRAAGSRVAFPTGRGGPQRRVERGTAVTVTVTGTPARWSTPTPAMPDAAAARARVRFQALPKATQRRRPPAGARARRVLQYRECQGPS